MQNQPSTPHNADLNRLAQLAAGLPIDSAAEEAADYNEDGKPTGPANTNYAARAALTNGEPSRG